MQTILGANGIIGETLAKELHQHYTQDIRLVGRTPHPINKTDELVKADLLHPDQTRAAVKGSRIAYLTVGLPYTNEVWTRDWSVVLNNVINACQEEGCKLVYFDNTYMYDQGVSLQTETTPFHPSGPKGQGKADAAVLLSTAMDTGKIEAMICRAPEFYGPGKTKSFINFLIFDALRKGKNPKVFVRDDTKRTLVYTPDAGAALALLGNTDTAYHQTWHLPCDDDRMTYREILLYISALLNQRVKYKVLRLWQLKLGSLFNDNLKESKELFSRYAIDNLFDSSKFKNAFPDFKVTPYREGIRHILTTMNLLP